jgi:hypothetical protein
MNKLHASALLVLAVCLLPLLALADGGRECVFDSDIGMFVPPNGSGACFSDSEFILFIFDDVDGDLVIAINEPDENQFRRLNPNGKGFFHTAQKDDVDVAYCSAETVASGACDIESRELYRGKGEVKVNSSVDDDFFFDCPFTARVKGTATDGFGNVVDFVAASTSVPDGDECKDIVEKIEVTPVDNL